MIPTLPLRFMEQVFEGAERLIRREEEEERDWFYCKGCESERVGNKICPLERAGCGIAESYQDIRFFEQGPVTDDSYRCACHQRQPGCGL